MVECQPAFQADRVHERLWEVPSQLSLDDVVFLRVEPGGAVCSACSLIPRTCLFGRALLVPSQRHPVAAQEKRSLGFCKRPMVVPKPVDEAVLGQVMFDSVDGRRGAGVLGGDGTAYRRGEKSGIDAAIVG